MGILSRIWSPQPSAHDLSNVNEKFWSGTIGARTASGVSVSPDTALNAAAVWAAVKVISETVGSVPLIMYRRRADGGKERATDHPLYDLLHDQPNRSQTAFEFKEMLTTHLLLRGNAYAEIVPGPRGPVDQLLPVHPDLVTPERRPDGYLQFRVRDGKGGERTLLQDEMLYLRGLSLDGVTGVSVITYARESIGLMQAAESYGARVFSQGAQPGGVLEHPKELSKEAAARVSESWQAAHSGLGNAHKVAVLEDGLTWKQTSMTSEDAQYLETRKFEISEMSRWFRVPAHMLGDLERATFSNIEHLGLEFVIYTMLAWFTRWEQAIKRDLILSPRTYFAEFLVDGLLRGDIKTRYEAYAIGRQWGWLSQNDIRRLENMNPIAGGDTYLTPLNMLPADQQAEAIEAANRVYAIIERNGHYADAE